MFAPVVDTATSAWNYTAQGRNWFGHGHVVLMHGEVDEMLSQAPDAFLLLTKLRRHNWGKTFPIANAMAETMGWTLRRLVAARKELERRGKVQLARQAHTGSAAIYAWA